MTTIKQRRFKEAAEALDKLSYLGLTITQESAEKVANGYRIRGRRAMRQKDYCLASRYFAASLFTELNSRCVRWARVRDLLSSLEKALDAQVADAVRPAVDKRKPLTSKQIRDSVEVRW